ncbi:PepSY domain-containing protein [Nonomuraea purpurea]|uniref:PepSY domain-containing protein n=1 Tax=Nonomuraea purpurea TaxID=1849276 RepID=A0ABV8GQS5_9ACTN
MTTPVGQSRLPLDQQIAAARAAEPRGKVSAVQPGVEAAQTTRVLLDVPGLAESTELAVFVDPYTAQVRGTLESYGSSGALPVRAWISNLHRHLHLGEPGRIYSELASVVVGVGVFLPLMGISLAAFLLIDALLGQRSRISLARRHS